MPAIRGALENGSDARPGLLSSPPHERGPSGNVDHRVGHRPGRRRWCSRVNGLDGIPGEWVGVAVGALLCATAFGLGYAE